MKILFLSLNSDPVSRLPSRYGGAGISFRRLVENLDNCYIAAETSCFEGDINNKTLCLTKEDIVNIKHGAFLDTGYHFPQQVDLFVYADPSITLNTNKPQLCWAVGAYEKIEANIGNLLVHNLKWQQPIIQNKETKIHEFVLGIDIPEFQVYNKLPFIFQCTNHYPQINSILLAQWCLKNKIRCIFAGPIGGDYRLLDYIDYNYVFYLGQIKEEEKIKLMKSATLHASLYSHNINGPNLSTKTALSYGAPILTTNFGIMPEVIKNEENGFIISNETEFLNAWDKSIFIDQKKCWETAQKWSLDKMVSSFKSVVDNILDNNYETYKMDGRHTISEPLHSNPRL